MVVTVGSVMSKSLLKTLAVFWVFFSISIQIQANTKPQVKPEPSANRVLFVGNSFSYYNDGIQNHLSALVKAGGKWQSGQSRFRLKAISGGRLVEHMAGLPPLFKNKPERQWDRVVLQDFSNGPISKKHQESFITATETIAKFVRSKGTEPILFMTWAYQGEEGMTEALAEAYTKQGNALNALVVPVGLAFDAASRSAPNIDLYVPDVDGFTEDGQVTYKKVLKHPSVAGTYLAACVFYAALYDASPVGLVYHAGLSKEDAQVLQAIAWQTHQQFYGQ